VTYLLNFGHSHLWKGRRCGFKFAVPYIYHRKLSSQIRSKLTPSFYRAVIRRERYCYGKLSVRRSVCNSWWIVITYAGILRK